MNTSSYPISHITAKYNTKVVHTFQSLETALVKHAANKDTLQGSLMNADTVKHPRSNAGIRALQSLTDEDHTLYNGKCIAKVIAQQSSHI